MFRIIKTIQQILINKRGIESNEYLKGFRDCYELLKIGLEKSDKVNHMRENARLKRMLYSLLHFERMISEDHLSTINDLFHQKNQEFILSDSLYTYVLGNFPIAIANNQMNILEVKLQDFMLKEILFKLIDHDFNLSLRQKKVIERIVELNISQNLKIKKILKYLTNIEIINEWPDRKNAERAKKILISENEKLKIIIDLLLTRQLYKYDRYELFETFKSKRHPLLRYKAMIIHLKKLVNNPGDKLFKLTSGNKKEIRNIIMDVPDSESLQELYNYINFILTNHERKTIRHIKMKTDSRSFSN